MSEWTPLAGLHAALGGRALPGEGIADYGTPLAEHACVRGAAGLIDLTSHGRFLVRGADHVSYLHRMLSNNVAARTARDGCHALYLTDRGHVRLDLRLYRLEDAVLLECEPAQRDDLIPALERLVIMDDVTFTDVTCSLAQLSLHGPRARDIVRAAGLVPRDALLDAAHQHAVVDAETVHPRVARHDRYGEEGFDFLVSWDEASTLANELLRVGGPMGLGVFGNTAAETLRIETGLPRWGFEFDAKTLPLEAGLEDAIDYEKGCYTGQEYIARATFVGRVQWRLASLIFDGAEVPPAGTELHALGEARRVAARVTSSTRSPALAAPIALAAVRRDYLAPDTRLEGPNGVRARVSTRPLVVGRGAVPAIGAPHPLART